MCNTKEVTDKKEELIKIEDLLNALWEFEISEYRAFATQSTRYMVLHCGSKEAHDILEDCYQEVYLCMSKRQKTAAEKKHAERLKQPPLRPFGRYDDE